MQPTHKNYSSQLPHNDDIMYGLHYVYLLKSLKNQSLYIGYTSNLQKRIAEHNEGDSYHTKKYAPWQLIYFESYRSKVDAYNREKSLKLHAQSLRRLKERLRDSLRS